MPVLSYGIAKIEAGSYELKGVMQDGASACTANAVNIAWLIEIMEVQKWFYFKNLRL